MRYSVLVFIVCFSPAHIAVPHGSAKPWAPYSVSSIAWHIKTIPTLFYFLGLFTVLYRKCDQFCGSAVFCQVVREGETGLHSAGWAGWAEEHRKPSKEEEWCRFHIAMTWTVEWHRSNPMSNQPCPLCFTKHSPHSVAHCIYSFCLLLSATRFLFILNSAFFPCFVCFKPNTHFSSAQVVYVTRLHTHQFSVCFGLLKLSIA